MFAYNHIQKTLQPIVENQINSECVANIKQLAEKHKEVLDIVSQYYAKFANHIEFLQTTLVHLQKTLTNYGVTMSQSGFEAAKDRIKPIVEKFQQQKDETDKVTHAILYLIIEYIKDSPFNSGISLDSAPSLAVMTMNVFLVGFASTLAAMALVQQQLKTTQQQLKTTQNNDDRTKITKNIE